ncbi:Hypothetical protein AA314_05400 [Archangium gephyra]|uniref:Uncharacterized protein n=1 Tax=Archangium gephyra TaxID=48 RepID=A0AAC8QAA3_9BACT|nr:Hypothetical protein AA314_05400 [Archangium gephyra]
MGQIKRSASPESFHPTETCPARQLLGHDAHSHRHHPGPTPAPVEGKVSGRTHLRGLTNGHSGAECSRSVLQSHEPASFSVRHSLNWGHSRSHQRGSRHSQRGNRRTITATNGCRRRSVSLRAWPHQCHRGCDASGCWAHQDHVHQPVLRSARSNTHGWTHLPERQIRRLVRRWNPDVHAVPSVHLRSRAGGGHV